MFTENTFLLGVLLVLAAAAGWFVARLTGGSRKQRQANRLSNDYFRGLNFLLSEQPDRAIEVFIRMVTVDSSTIETHFALGSLFRRRGEVDRAIRIHQNLIARPNLSRLHRSHALYELGDDYMKAGLFDRAENLFLELTNERHYSEQALRHLITIYEQQKDWSQAVGISRQLETASGLSRHEEIAQYYCEMAEIAVEIKDVRQATRALKRAQSYSRRSVRPLLIYAQLAEQQGDRRLAIKHYRQVLTLSPEFAVEVLPQLARLAQQKGHLSGHLSGQLSGQETERGSEQGFSNFTTVFQKQSPLAATQLALTTILHPKIQTPAAEDAVESFIRNSEHLKGLYEIIGLISGDKPASQTLARDRVREVLRRLLSSGPRYRCRECGFTAKTLYWQCPSCKTWNSVRPFFDFSFRGVTPEVNLSDSGRFQVNDI